MTHLQPGAATCSEGFVKYFLRVPQAVGLYCNCRATKQCPSPRRQETGGGEGVEVVKNEPFEGLDFLGGKYTKGQYTYKIYHVDTKVPPLLRYYVGLHHTQVRPVLSHPAEMYLINIVIQQDLVSENASLELISGFNPVEPDSTVLS